MKILECSTAGNKNFSAFGAYIDFFGKWDSIEHHYQSVKKDALGKQVKKGQRVDHVIIFNGSLSYRLEPSCLTALYKLMWCCYLDAHPELVELAKQYDDYNDKFKGKAINCQADVIRQYIKQGRKSILKEQDVIDLRKRLKI